MFEIADIDHHIGKDEFERREQELRERLLASQLELRERGKQSVLLLIAGVDAGGKGETIQQLNSWLDPRHIRTRAFAAPNDEERERPYFWRYWRELPALGQLGVFFDSWYRDTIEGRAFGKLKAAAFDRQLDAIRRFEQMLADENIVLLKLWFHLSKQDQRERLRALEKDKRTRWRVTEQDWEHHDRHDRLVDVATRCLRITSTDDAPWIVVPGKDPNYRSLVVGQALLDALDNDDVAAPPGETSVHPVPPLDGKHVLRDLATPVAISKKVYEDELAMWQGELAKRVRSKEFRKRSLVVVFEGVDAAGKGGAIRRLTGALDPRSYDVVPIAAPTDEEKAHPYLWRFWRHLPRRGKVLVFDRSWYGRVLVERVESYCSSRDWMRAYGEINDFEEQLHGHGAIIVKLWLHIDRDEQLRRFQAREQETHKRWKIGPDDWRNRDKWSDYELAVNDMVDRTSTEFAPWALVAANDKQTARIAVLRKIVERIDAELDR
jgi:polyphosphate:AMP phosphotransferase